MIDHVTFRRQNGKIIELKEGEEMIASILSDDVTTMIINIQSSVRHVVQKTTYVSSDPKYQETSFITLLTSLALNTLDSSSVFMDPRIVQEAESGTSGLFLELCLQNFFRREILDYSADYTCEKCGKVVELIRDLRIIHPPKVLILHLMRFAFDVSGAVKIYESVTYPLHVWLGLESED